MLSITLFLFNFGSITPLQSFRTVLLTLILDFLFASEVHVGLSFGPIVVEFGKPALFLPLLFLGHSFRLILASGSFAASAFTVPPQIRPRRNLLVASLRKVLPCAPSPSLAHSVPINVQLTARNRSAFCRQPDSCFPFCLSPSTLAPFSTYG
jgi:hypothetical protein